MILLSYGTRPEYIKIKPLIDIFEKNNFPFKVLFTGQQVNLADFYFDYVLHIKEGGNRLDTVVKSIMDNLQPIIRDSNPTYVLVQGDTTSAFAMALSAFHHKLKVIHLEAGLRTYDNDNPYPEEVNRKLISQLADIHLCPTEHALSNLCRENIEGMKVLCGNTVIDNLVSYKEKCEYTDKILVTLHRRENHEIMDKWFTQIERLAKKYVGTYEFILPLHPNPNVQKHKDLLKHVFVVDPLPYEDLLELLVKTRLVISDSGGIQEECSFFNKKCLTCRVVTERPEAMNQSTFLVKSPDDLFEMFEEHHNDYKIDYVCPFGDGKSSEKIYKFLTGWESKLGFLD